MCECACGGGEVAVFVKGEKKRERKRRPGSERTNKKGMFTFLSQKVKKNIHGGCNRSPGISNIPERQNIPKADKQQLLATKRVQTSGRAREDTKCVVNLTRSSRYP